MELFVYDLSKLSKNSLVEPKILTFYPHPKEVLDIIVYQSNVYTNIGEYLKSKFPDINIFLMPMEFCTVLYKLGDSWYEKEIGLKEALLLHREASLFAEITNYIVTKGTTEYSYDERRDRNIVKIPIL